MAQLIDSYKYAYTDFHGSGTPCVYKTGPSWPINAPDRWKITRAARPIYNHPIQPSWLDIAWRIVAQLDSLQLDWNTINPLAYANAGESSLICAFVITIGVKPGSLAYPVAVAAANAVVEILQNAGFPNIQVAFIESVYRRCGSGHKLMSFNPPVELDDIQALRKPFILTPSQSIAPRASPYYEGTGGLFFRLGNSEGDKRLVPLTCAHVAHPPPLFQNKIYTRENDMQPREDIIILGTGSFDRAVQAILEFISNQTISIRVWDRSLNQIREPQMGEPQDVAQMRKGLMNSIESARIKIERADELHTKVTKHFTTFASRKIGFVLHTDKIEVGDDKFLYDWSFIQMDEYVMEWETFKGNKLFVGGNKTAVDWIKFMFPQLHDRQDFHWPNENLLQLKHFVPEAEFRNPQNFDVNDARTLLAVKNGSTTGTTFGRVNGLESITRHYSEDGIHEDALEYIVLGYDTAATRKNEKFSDCGDSGAIVAGRDGRIIGKITGGAGPTDELDKTYITPFYKLKNRIEERYPDCYLFPVVA